MPCLLWRYVALCIGGALQRRGWTGLPVASGRLDGQPRVPRRLGLRGEVFPHGASRAVGDHLDRPLALSQRAPDLPVAQRASVAQPEEPAVPHGGRR